MPGKYTNPNSPVSLTSYSVLHLCPVDNFMLHIAGYTSYVYNEETGGSVYINTLVETLAQNSADQDIQTMLTWVSHLSYSSYWV